VKRWGEAIYTLKRNCRQTCFRAPHACAHHAKHRQPFSYTLLADGGGSGGCRLRRAACPLCIVSAVTTYRVQLLHHVPVSITSPNAAVLHPCGAPPWRWRRMLTPGIEEIDGQHAMAYADMQINICGQIQYRIWGIVGYGNGPMGAERATQLSNRSG
jgi:hypothetical protein